MGRKDGRRTGTVPKDTKQRDKFCVESVKQDSKGLLDSTVSNTNEKACIETNISSTESVGSLNKSLNMQIQNSNPSRSTIRDPRIPKRSSAEKNEYKEKCIERVLNSINDLLKLEENLESFPGMKKPGNLKEVHPITQKEVSPLTQLQEDPKEIENQVCTHCKEVASTRCTGCHLVFYCGRECQKLDWKGHKDLCRPYTIIKRKDMGRMLVASRELKPDDLILTESPLVLGPRQVTEPVCLSCFRKIVGDFRCSKCSWPMCSKECESGEFHKLECEFTRTSGAAIDFTQFEAPCHLYEAVTVLRCLIVALKEPLKWKSGIDRFSPGVFQLISSPQFVQDQQEVIKILKKKLNIDSYPGLDCADATLYKILGFLQLNHVPTKLPYAEVQGLYAMSSLMSHSCTPNTRLTWDNISKKLNVKATENILPGTPITTIYTDILWGTRARRDHLQQTRLISCTCARCSDPTELDTFFSALICRRCPKRAFVLPTDPLNNNSPWTCTKCGYEIKSEEVLKQTLALGASVEEALTSPSIEILEALQKEWTPRVHSNHYHLHAVKHSLLQLYGRAQEKTEDKDERHWEEIAKKERACKEFLRVCSLLDPALANTVPFVGLTFFEYHKTILQNAKKNFGVAKINTHQLKKRMLLAKALLKKAMDIFRDEAGDTPEGQLYLTCQDEVISIGKWMLAVGLV